AKLFPAFSIADASALRAAVNRSASPGSRSPGRNAKNASVAASAAIARVLFVLFKKSSRANPFPATGWPPSVSDGTFIAYRQGSLRARGFSRKSGRFIPWAAAKKKRNPGKGFRSFLSRTCGSSYLIFRVQVERPGHTHVLAGPANGVPYL